MDTKKFYIEKAESSIEWIGKKVTGAHNGTVNILDGFLTLTGGELSGGNFTIDTTSIKILDIADADTNAQFGGHLASEDFFASEKYPTATMEITGVSHRENKNYHIAGNLTIRGISNPVEFDAEILNGPAGTLRASGKLVIDRTKYNMKFRSGNFFKDLGDTLIYNEFDLVILLTAKSD
jgi:polyisoprenoid-binding protein YceI